jgi:DNA-binding CsgD family transcriptional regulator
MHPNKKQYGIELYDLLQCVNFNNPTKDLAIGTLLNWAENYIDFSSVVIHTIQINTQLSVDFYYDKGLPKEWIKEYRSKNYAMADPVIQYALTADGIFSWHDAFSSTDTPRGREVITRARTYGLHRGYSYLMRTSKSENQDIKLLSLSNVSPKSNVEFEHIITTLGAAAFYLMENIIDNKKSIYKEVLNANELQILDWSAKGKSIWEISQITNISERTIKYHLTNTYRKLQASNKTQAVSAALKLGLLR